MGKRILIITELNYLDYWYRIPLIPSGELINSSLKSFWKTCTNLINLCKLNILKVKKPLHEWLFELIHCVVTLNRWIYLAYKVNLMCLRSGWIVALAM